MENWVCMVSGRWFRFVGGFEQCLPGSNAFQKGYCCGLLLEAAILILLLILILLFKWIFRTGSVESITLERPDGNVVISRSAMTSLILALEEKIPELELLKVHLLKLPKRFIKITVLVNLRSDEDSFPILAETLKSRVFENLQQVLGIENVKTVEIRLHKKLGKPLPPVPPAHPENVTFYGTGF